ncbi:hypothetical protein [Lysinibacillus sphaericus]
MLFLSPVRLRSRERAASNIGAQQIFFDSQDVYHDLPYRDDII